MVRTIFCLVVIIGSVIGFVIGLIMFLFGSETGFSVMFICALSLVAALKVSDPNFALGLDESGKNHSYARQYKREKELQNLADRINKKDL